eukprot:CFRG6574T1
MSANNNSAAKDDLGRIMCDDGTSIIPATRRPDGTWRKERKVKAGYVPQDEQVRFMSRGTVMKEKRKALGVVGLSAAQQPQVTLSKNQKKNIRKKEQRVNGEKSKAENEIVTGVKQMMLGKDSVMKSAEEKSTPASAPEVATAPVDPAKKLRNLQKKLKQCLELEKKIVEGIVKPTSEQQEKIENIPLLRSQIAHLQLAA